MKDPTRMDLAARLEIENGDLWYSKSNCDEEVVISEITTGYLEFTPDFFRGPACTDLEWRNGLFTPPTRLTPSAEALAPPAPVDDLDPNCRVFSPGRYTSISLATNNYFKAGDYYFENVFFDIKSETVVAGFPGGFGDAPKISNLPCSVHMNNDNALNAGDGGATFYFGGTSRINVENQGQFEIFRRKQAETFMSVVAIEAPGPSYMASSLDWNDWILETKSGSNNDVAIHGLFWSPYAGMTLGNITNAANGQLLGGVVLANLDTQASASATAFAIGIESNPVDTRLLLISTAEKGGQSTSIRAVVQFRPDTGELAVNSWRVLN
jgi:hypothetical protein